MCKISTVQNQIQFSVLMQMVQLRPWLACFWGLGMSFKLIGAISSTPGLRSHGFPQGRPLLLLQLNRTFQTPECWRYFFSAAHTSLLKFIPPPFNFTFECSFIKYPEPSKKIVTVIRLMVT
jgi:hypothetical protein